ncbi:MAG: hypothetical protein FWH47_01370 [Methanomassiliicoccaceae archaeon]|nr:hypothetical protein [Methanomassiliicoccaceae archaeon]
MSEKRNVERRREAFKTLEALIESRVLELIGLGSGSDAFSYAKTLMDICMDDYHGSRLTPMDALIVSDALIDNECTTVYTTDKNILWNRALIDEVNGIRHSMGASYPILNFSSFE